MVVNPNATLYTTWGVYSSRWWGSAPATGAHSIVTNASDGPVGLKTYARKTWSTTSSSGDTGYDVYAFMSVSPGDQFTFSCYVRPSVNRSFEIGVYEHSPETTFVSRSRSASQSIPAGTWSRLTYVYTVPDGISYIHHWACDSNSSSSANWAVGSTLDATGFMVTKGSTLYNYADPTINSSWAWTGTSNNSTSTGPAP